MWVIVTGWVISSVYSIYKYQAVFQKHKGRRMYTFPLFIFPIIVIVFLYFLWPLLMFLEVLFHISFNGVKLIHKRNKAQ